MSVIDSLPRAIRILKQKNLYGQVAAVRLAGHFEGIFLGTHDRDVLNTLNASVLALRTAFSTKTIDPVAVVDFAALVAQEVRDIQRMENIRAGVPAQPPVEGPVAPVEPPAPVEAVAPVEPVAQEKVVAKSGRGKQ